MQRPRMLVHLAPKTPDFDKIQPIPDPVPNGERYQSFLWYRNNRALSTVFDNWGPNRAKECLLIQQNKPL